MTNINSDHSDVSDLINRHVVDSGGDKVGTVVDVYMDEDTNQPEWLAVTTGLFGSKISFVPIRDIGVTGDDVVVPFDKATVKDSPRAEADGQLSSLEERELYAYYGRSYESAAPTVTTAQLPTPPAAPRAGLVPPSAPTAQASTVGQPSMTRSEEEMTIDTRQREAGRVRLRKWVETENVQVTVPVKRQMARLVVEPVDPAHAGPADIVADDDGEVVVLWQEEIDVSKQVVAKERVAIETYTETEDVVVDEALRRERVQVESDASGSEVTR